MDAERVVFLQDVKIHEKGHKIRVLENSELLDITLKTRILQVLT